MVSPEIMLKAIEFWENNPKKVREVPKGLKKHEKEIMNKQRLYRDRGTLTPKGLQQLRRDTIAEIGQKNIMKVRKDSLAGLGKEGFDIIKKLSESQSVVDKLMGFNGVLFSLVLSILLTKGFFPNPEPLSFLMGLLIFGLLSFASLIVYIPLLKLLTNFTQNKITALKFSIYFLFIAWSLVGLSFIFNIPLISQISYFFIALQFFVIPFGIVLPKTNVKNKEISFGEIWVILDKAGIILGIISSLITIVALFIKF